jgi:hypothetical protein
VFAFCKINGKRARTGLGLVDHCERRKAIHVHGLYLALEELGKSMGRPIEQASNKGTSMIMRINVI